LTRAFNDIASAQLNASTKASLLSEAWDQLYKPAIDQTHASDAWYIALNNVTDATDKNRYSMNDHSTAAIESRNRISDAAKASKDLWLQDLALHGQTPKVNQDFRDRMKVLEGVAGHYTATKGEVHKLVGEYGHIPPKKNTVVTVNPNNAIAGLQKIYDMLVNNYIAQYAFEHHITPGQSAKLYADQNTNPNLLAAEEAAKAGRHSASGGVVAGTYDGRDDTKKHWLTVGEFVTRRRVVDKPGVRGLLTALNEERLDPALIYAGLTLATQRVTQARPSVHAVPSLAAAVTNNTTNTRNSGLALGDVTINNPVREPSDRSLRRTLQTLAYLGAH
jgi:hypothetical protein